MLDAMTITAIEADAGPVTLTQRIRETLALWHRRTRERNDLALLSEYDLHDAGITSTDAWLEMRKPFWRE